MSHYNNSGAAAVVDGLGYNSGLGKKPVVIVVLIKYNPTLASLNGVSIG